jgi:hypothetical protein
MKKILRNLVPICLVVTSIGAPRPACAEHNLLANGDFATDIENWQLETDAGFALSWDETMGQPAPGSLQLSGTYTGVGFPTATALSECFDVPIGVQLILETQIYGEVPDGAIRCTPFLARYSGPGCTGDRGFTGSGAGAFVLTPDNDEVWRQTVSFHDFSVGSTSFRVGLVHQWAGGVEIASCRFDSIVLREEGDLPAVTEIPTAGETGLILFAVLLGVLAPWWLRARVGT